MPSISPDDTWTLLAIIVAGTGAAIEMERRWRWAARLSAPVLALLIAMVRSNTGIMPQDKPGLSVPAYDVVGGWLLPLALPLLLFRANLVRIARETGRLFAAFHLATLGTVLGAFAAFWLTGHLVPEAGKSAGVMTGSYIGGMVNFTAVSESTQLSESTRGALIVADNFVMALLFVALLSIAGSAFFRRHWHADTAQSAAAAPAPDETRPAPGVLDLAFSLAVALAVVAVSLLLQKKLLACFPAQAGDGWLTVMGKTLLTNKFVLITTLSVLAATAFPRTLERLRSGETVGSFLLYLFLFTIGLPADLRTVFTDSPGLFGFCFIMVAVNLGFTLAAGKLLRLPLEDLLLASNATVGGPPSAAAMAMSKGWHSRVLPGLLAGLYGYVIGTPLGLLIYSLLSR